MSNNFAYIQHKGLDLFVVSPSSDYNLAIVDMASPNKDVSYVMSKETPYVVNRSPYAATITITKIYLTYPVLILSTWKGNQFVASH